MALLRQFEGLPHVATITTLLDRLRSRQPPGGSEPDVIFLEVNPLVAGLHWLAPIHAAIRQGQALRIFYQPFSTAAPLALAFSPAQLREYRNRWFLLRYAPGEEAPLTLALDRIQDLYPDGHPAQLPGGLAERFRHVVGVSVPATEPVGVRLRVRPEQVPYLLTKPLHPSQTVGLVEADGSREFSYWLHLNFELESEILALGERVEVLGPEALRNRIADRLREAARLYHPSPPGP